MNPVAQQLAKGARYVTTSWGAYGHGWVLVAPEVTGVVKVEVATESETAQPTLATFTQAISVGAVSEIDLAGLVDAKVGVQTVVVTFAVETEASSLISVTSLHEVTVGASAEVESSEPVLADTPVLPAGYITLDGVGDSISTPDAAQLDITGDIDVRVCVAADEWDNGGIGANSRQTMIGKWVETGNQRSWRFSFQPSGSDLLPFFAWSANGSTGLTISPANTIPQPNDGEPTWFRVTLDVDDGTGRRAFAFYWSDEPPTTDPDSVTWTLISAATGGSGTATSIFNSTAPVRVGHTTGTEAQFAGKFYYAEVRDGIGGTKVADPDPRTDDQGWSSPPATDNLGNVWSFHGDAFWTGDPSTGATIPVVGATESEASQPVSVLLLDQVIEVSAAIEGEQANPVSVLLPPLSTVGAGWGVPIGIS